jgi:hypothetical protein
MSLPYPRLEFTGHYSCARAKSRGRPGAGDRRCESRDPAYCDESPWRAAQGCFGPPIEVDQAHASDPCGCNHAASGGPTTLLTRLGQVDWRYGSSRKGSS